MIKTMLGVILLLVPFLLLHRFKDKKLGFAYILCFLIAFHLALAVTTQAFGVFSWSLAVIINAIVDIVILTRINYRGLKAEIKKINFKNIDWVLVFIIIVLFIELFSVHYNYTGKVTSAVENYKEVKNMKYVYPYFSDEWVAVSLAQYSIASGKLPIASHLWYDNFFPNLEMPFHSFASELILFFGLNPLTQYTLITLFSGLIICVLVYLILRVNKVGRFASAVAALAVPWIINGANLPGLWTFIPLIMGIISMLLGILFISANKCKMVLFSGLLALIFYPPLFILYSFALVFYFVFSDLNKKQKIKYTICYFLIAIAASFLVSIFTYSGMNSSFSNFAFSYIRGKLIYPTFTSLSIPNFPIYKIIPIPILILSIFGVFKLIKKKSWLVAPVLVGLVYWWFYSFVLWRFIIEYERVVFATSILLVVLAGFGLHYLLEDLRDSRLMKNHRKLVKYIKIIILILFIVFAFFYTQRDTWKDLRLYSVLDNTSYNPASPANQYLHEDDLKLFKNISEKKFLSLPWKGLVIGVATENYPLETKESTITNQFIRHNEFVKADCGNKTELAKGHGIQYVYSWEFNCTGFKEVGKSEEDLVLYEVE